MGELTMPDAGRGPAVVPRPVVNTAVVLLLMLLVFDVTAGVPVVPWHVPGHTPSPLISGGILTIIGAVITASRGPRPTPEEEDPEMDLSGNGGGRER